MKKIINSVVFILILILILVLLGFILSPDFLSKNNIVDKKSDINTRLANEVDNSLDIIILGDSESYTSISPMELWKNYGYTSYNFGQVGATLSDVKEAYINIATKQKPAIVLLETNCLYRSDIRNNEAGNMISRVIYNIFPVTKYHDNWKIPFEDKKKGNFKGFTISTTIDPCDNKDYMIATDKEDAILSDNIDTLNDINKLCKENNARLILYSAPSPGNYNYLKHNALEKVANELGVEYIDLNLCNNDIKIDYTTDTRDGGDHLNVYGSIKVSDYIGKYLHDNYSMLDRRNDDIADSFNKMLIDYNKELND